MGELQNFLQRGHAWNQKPVLKVFWDGPNSFFNKSKERVRSDLKCLKNRLQGEMQEKKSWDVIKVTSWSLFEC